MVQRKIVLQKLIELREKDVRFVFPAEPRRPQIVTLLAHFRNCRIKREREWALPFLMQIPIGEQGGRAGGRAGGKRVISRPSFLRSLRPPSLSLSLSAAARPS